MARRTFDQVRPSTLLLWFGVACLAFYPMLLWTYTLALWFQGDAAGAIGLGSAALVVTPILGVLIRRVLRQVTRGSVTLDESGVIVKDWRGVDARLAYSAVDQLVLLKLGSRFAAPSIRLRSGALVLKLPRVREWEELLSVMVQHAGLVEVGATRWARLYARTASAGQSAG